MRVNPFRPGSIVTSGMFAGRVEELRALAKGLFQTKNGNPWHFLIHGERGIGKSSLLFYVKLVAQGKITASGTTKYNFITLNIDLNPNSSFEDIIRKVGSEFVKELKQREAARNKLKDLWGWISRWEVLGVKFDRQQGELGEPIVWLCDTFVAALERLGDSLDGVLILIDEADKPPSNAHFGGFTKLFTEYLTKKSCDNVAIGVSGISSVLGKMRESHESSLRIFQHIKLEPLIHEERLRVIELGMQESNKLSEEKTTIEPEAADWIAKYSEGFPHFIQQYASSAFDTDTDQIIDIDDVIFGAVKENGAIDQLGVRYFEDMYHEQINSDEYRKVLQVMAESNEEYVSRKYILEASGLKKTTLDNALQALKNRRIILKHESKQGLYKLPSDSFGVWINAKSRRDKEQDAKKKKLQR